MVRFKQYTGGDLATHGYCVQAPEGVILFDAPEGADEFFSSEKIDLLLLTHGHFDHIADAARIRKRHHCQVGIHADSAPMLANAGFFKNWGFPIEIEPIEKPDLLLEESSKMNFLGLDFQVFLIPGHCPGSLCFLAEGNLFGGDVLFREGVGRWDLPGGSQETLLHGIQTKLFPLPEDTQVYPGHGPSTTIGHEKQANPYFNFT